MKHIKTISSALALVALAAACGGEDAGTSNGGSGTNTTTTGGTGTTMSTGMTTTTGGTGTGTSTSTGTSCTPVTCEASACGQQNDGCGGTIDCGACACDKGVPQATNCGNCGLGRPSCDAGVTTKEFSACEFSIPALSDLDNASECDRIVYVDGSSGAGQGTLADPYGTLANALSELKMGGAAVVIVAGGTSYDEPLIVQNAVSVTGGYVRRADGSWSLDRAVRPVFKPTTTVPMVGRAGLVARGVNEDTEVAHVEVIAPDASSGQADANSYGAYVRQSRNLVFTSVSVRAGKGGGGLDGQPGQNGASGPAGEEGLPKLLVTEDAKGRGGVNAQCTGANGGDGGNGVKTFAKTIDRNPEAGEDSPAGAKGGAPGVVVSGGLNYDGKNGEDGSDQNVNGANGDKGSSGGQVVDGLWVSMGSGKGGLPGTDGGGGGGGGGAGISSVNFRRLAGIKNLVWAKGGGGGAGGCGGQPGQGGTGGGGSFGLFAVDSQIELVDSIFQGSQGGNGGRGGLGGAGAPGGPGGQGNVKVSNILGAVLPTERSGDGGDGGRGANGGAGGGGAGGVSYGAYCNQSTVNVKGSSSFVAGPSAVGGRSDGISGEDGTSEDEFRCR